MGSHDEMCSTLVTCSLCEHEGSCRRDPEEHNRWLLRQRLSAVQKRILVVSNKGGVGKSTVAANLAAALAAAGLATGLVDADLTGPSVPHLFGLRQTRVRMGDSGLVPPEPLPNLKVASLGFLLPDVDSPVMWRDSFKYEFLQQLVGGFEWGALDVLLVDMPPGTGGELIGMVELLERVDGAVVVTTPQEVALCDVRRGVASLRDCGVPILGIVENMAGLACPHCGGEIHPFKSGGGADLARQLEVPLLARVPLDPQAMCLADDGRPVVLADPDGPAGSALTGAAASVAQQVLARQG